MQKQAKIVLILGTILIASLGISSSVSAHPGRTDAYGCHTCRTNCPSWGLSYGEYHCHNAKALPQPEEPIKSKYGEGGTGVTMPAPEYKQPAVKAEPPKASIESKENIESKMYSNAYDSNEAPKVSLWKKILNWFFGK